MEGKAGATDPAAKIEVGIFHLSRPRTKRILSHKKAQRFSKEGKAFFR